VFLLRNTSIFVGFCLFVPCHISIVLLNVGAENVLLLGRFWWLIGIHPLQSCSKCVARCGALCSQNLHKSRLVTLVTTPHQLAGLSIASPDLRKIWVFYYHSVSNCKISCLLLIMLYCCQLLYKPGFFWCQLAMLVPLFLFLVCCSLSIQTYPVKLLNQVIDVLSFLISHEVIFPNNYVYKSGCGVL